MMTNQAGVRPAIIDAACPPPIGIPDPDKRQGGGMIGVCLRVWPRCFTELRSVVGVVTAKVLAQILRDMKRDGFITRCGLRVDPPYVEYELTPLEGALWTSSTPPKLRQLTQIGPRRRCIPIWLPNGSNY